jgi:nucleotide-binding universal stress UspA family protein
LLHFLFYVSFSLYIQDSEKSLHWAIENLYRPGDIFHLLHLIPEPTMVHIWAGIYVPPDEDAELVEIEDTKEFVKHRFLQTLLAAKVPFQLHVILGPTDSESIAKVIAKKVDDLSAEAVVMAKHTKGKLKEYWLGSVTKELIKRVKIPVAVVPHSA